MYNIFVFHLRYTPAHHVFIRPIPVANATMLLLQMLFFAPSVYQYFIVCVTHLDRLTH